jgi:hypothetical protein
MDDKNRELLRMLLGYLDGSGDPSTNERIRRRLEDPESPESQFLHEIDALLTFWHSDQSLEITRELVDEYLDEIPRLSPLDENDNNENKSIVDNGKKPMGWTDRVDKDDPKRQIGE